MSPGLIWSQSIITLGAATGGGIAGSVTLTGAGTPVGGGTIEIWSSNGLVFIDSAVINGSGAFSISSLPAATYRCRLQPPRTHSIGPSEPDYQTVVVTNGVTATQNFVAQLAVSPGPWLFSDYANTAALTNLSTGAFTGSGMDDGGQGGWSSDISLNSGKMRYTWPARGSLTSAYTVARAARWAPCPASLGPVVALRWKDRFSTGWAAGNQPGSTSEYKVMLLQVGPGGPPGQLGMYFEGNPATAVKIDLTDRIGHNANTSPPLATASLPVGWDSQDNVWVLILYGAGTSSAYGQLWLNNSIILTTDTVPFRPGETIGGAGILFPNIGANINNGPTLSQTRDFTEFGVYYSRPSTV